MASSTVRVIGPSLSSDQQRVMAPERGTRPNVGRSPVTPHRIAGLMMEPPVSLPSEKATRAAVVAAPGPALEPEAPSSGSHGFIVCPPNQMSFSASAPILSFAMRIAPASFSRATTAESVSGTRSRKGSAPYVVATPAVSTRSFAPQGMPWSGPRYFPAAISASLSFASARAASRTSVMTLLSLPSKRSIRSR
jgi:hypothetical protein